MPIREVPQGGGKARGGLGGHVMCTSPLCRVMHLTDLQDKQQSSKKHLCPTMTDNHTAWLGITLEELRTCMRAGMTPAALISDMPDLVDRILLSA